MTANQIILKKRGTFILENGKKILSGNTELSQEEINFIVNGYVSGEIPEYQISSFLMAVYFNGMTFKETGFLTSAMLNSGERINLQNQEKDGLSGPFVDKHSTGGVGDKISLPLAPIVASSGVQIPMMSGRALGHTGGTLDKLESITGYNVNLSQKDFKKFIAENGYAMTGQTEKIVPADRLLYALRDVTGTVESIPLITASILSKKIAEGSDALVFDVKFGSGAFMKTYEDAKMLAKSLVETAKSMGLKSTAVLTDMSTPLGNKIGNFLEIEETIDCLSGKGPKDVMEETFTLGSWMLYLAGKVSSLQEGIKLCENAVNSGKALECFYKNVQMQGGDIEKLKKDIKNRRSKFKTELKAEKDGYIFIDAYKTGCAGVTLGVGRNKTTDSVCAEAGMILLKRTGDFVKKGETIMEVFGKNEESLETSLLQLKNAVTYQENPLKERKLIYETIN